MCLLCICRPRPDERRIRRGSLRVTLRSVYDFELPWFLPKNLILKEMHALVCKGVIRKDEGRHAAVNLLQGLDLETNPGSSSMFILEIGGRP